MPGRVAFRNCIAPHGIAVHDTGFGVVMPCAYVDKLIYTLYKLMHGLWPTYVVRIHMTNQESRVSKFRDPPRIWGNFTPLNYKERIWV